MAAKEGRGRRLGSGRFGSLQNVLRNLCRPGEGGDRQQEARTDSTGGRDGGLGEPESEGTRLRFPAQREAVQLKGGQSKDLQFKKGHKVCFSTMKIIWGWE